MTRGTERRPESETWWIEAVPERRFGIQGWRAIAKSSDYAKLGNMKCFEGGCIAYGYWRRRQEDAIARVQRDLEEYEEDLARQAEDEARIVVIPWKGRPGTL